MNQAGTFLPPPREVRAVIEGLQGQNPALACPPPPAPQVGCAVTSANGIFYGQYHAPIGEYIFPENVPGTPIVENNFSVLDFLAFGGYSSNTGVMCSCVECVPKRPPALQKLPESSGTVHVETPTGIASVVISKIRIICRYSWHSLPVVSPMSVRKFLTCPLRCFANSDMFIWSSG